MFGIDNIANTRKRVADLSNVQGLHELGTGLTKRIAFTCEHDPKMLLVFDLNNAELERRLDIDLIDLPVAGVIQVTMHSITDGPDGSRTATLLHPLDYIWSISSYECPDACEAVYLLAYASAKAPSETYELFVPVAQLN